MKSSASDDKELLKLKKEKVGQSTERDEGCWRKGHQALRGASSRGRLRRAITIRS